MADVVDKATRSRMMSGIRAKNTRPEMSLRRGLHALGFRFRLHAKNVPGKPDVVLPKYRALIFVHGCFWHGHGCRYFKIPKTNTRFWQEKILGNKRRDAQTVQLQLQMGWRCLVVWECAMRFNVADTVAACARWVVGSDAYAEIDESVLNCGVAGTRLEAVTGRGGSCRDS